MSLSPHLRIESAAVEHVAALSRIARECELTVDFAVELERSYAQVLVALSGETAQGFLLAWRAADELHLTDLGVTVAARRQGIARNLVLALEAIGKRTSAAVILLEVRASNAAGRALYSQLGFAEVATRPGYYSDTNEDAVVMQRKLS